MRAQKKHMNFPDPDLHRRGDHHDGKSGDRLSNSRNQVGLIVQKKHPSPGLAARAHPLLEERALLMTRVSIADRAKEKRAPPRESRHPSRRAIGAPQDEEIQKPGASVRGLKAGAVEDPGSKASS